MKETRTCGGAATILAVAAFSGLAVAEDLNEPRPRSGYEYMLPETRAMQDDEFGNPGMLWVEQGAELWRAPAGPDERSCAGCHGDAAESMRGAGATYPRYDPAQGKLVNLEQRINQCRGERMGAPAFAYESDELVALTTFVRHQSRGMPIDVSVDGPARPFYERGRAFYRKRRGHFDLACHQCHDENSGRRFRAERLSQGQINGLPAYKLKWQTVGSTHRQFRWCNTLARSVPYPYGSDEYVNLELYVTHRGQGLPVETPGVRP